jgi:uncharacterized membrane protein
MIPLCVLAGTLATALLITALRTPNWRPNVLTSLRIAVGAMFLVTGLSHFTSMRDQMIQMVPDGLPSPESLVTLTGLLEIVASVAMTSKRLAPVAAWCLTLLLVLMFPANIHLALTGTDLPWTSTLVPRATMQLLFLSATIALGVLGSAALHQKRAKE